jgi:hypothetical protein
LHKETTRQIKPDIKLLFILDIHNLIALSLVKQSSFFYKRSEALYQTCSDALLFLVLAILESPPLFHSTAPPSIYVIHNTIKDDRLGFALQRVSIRSLLDKNNLNPAASACKPHHNPNHSATNTADQKNIYYVD